MSDAGCDLLLTMESPGKRGWEVLRHARMDDVADDIHQDSGVGMRFREDRYKVMEEYRGKKEMY